jgi:transposase
VYDGNMKLRVAYAKRRYKDKVYVTPLIVTSYRDENGVARNKTIVSLAKLPDWLVKWIERGLKHGDESVLDDYVHIDQVRLERAWSVGPVFVVMAVLRELGIFSLLMGALSLKQAVAILSIIVERVTQLKPLSVMALQRQFEQDALSQLLGMERSPALKTWYTALGRLEEKREEILANLFERNHTPGQLYLYDITSSYFEGQTCALGEYGYNRDGKKGKKQVVIGVICDADGCPIWVDVFKGNTSDQTTVKAQLINLKTKLGVQEFTFVGDRGMVTNARIEELEQEGWWETFSYITALKRSEMMAFVENNDHPIQLDMFDHKNLVEVHDGPNRYVLCHNPHREQQDRDTRLRLLDRTEQKLRSIDNNVQAGRYKKNDVIAKRVHRWVDHWKMERFFEIEYGEGHFCYSRNEKEIERYSALDGCYVIRSNAAKKHSSKRLVERYKDLKFVEQAFRHMKTTDINVRPIRHFNVTQVRGHIFACFLAYRVIWELRQRLHPVLERDSETRRCEAGSLAEVWRALGSIGLGKMVANGRTFFKLTDVSLYANKLLKLCRAPSLEEIFR